MISAAIRKIQEKQFQIWLPAYLRHLASRASGSPSRGLRHLLFAVCDHFEPLWGQPGDAIGIARVEHWRERYPKLADQFRDADGRKPNHSFFFPGEEYRPAFFDSLEELMRRGYGEIELHLHHDGATAESARREIESYVATYSARGHLSRDRQERARYAFIHGNWALANARPDGRWCGVDNELEILFETGCYADFTFPSVPDVSQPGIVNQIYWPSGDVSRRRAYEHGERARTGRRFDDRILMIEGPLALSRRENTWLPRIEYGALTAKDPGSLARVKSWVREGIHVAGRPEWVFVKVYTHGAPEAQAASYLGAGGHALHQALCEHFNDGRRWSLHYVSAREMYNIALATMAGKSGNPNEYRDYELPPPPIVAATR